MGVRENKIERYLDSEVLKLGGLTRKWVSPGRNGVPDRIVITNNIVVGVEVKCTDGKLSTAQIRELSRLQDASMLVTIVYGKSGVDGFITHMKRFINEFNSGTSATITYLQQEYR